MDFVLQFERKILQDGMHIFHNTQSKSAMRERYFQKRTLVCSRSHGAYMYEHHTNICGTHKYRKKSQQFFFLLSVCGTVCVRAAVAHLFKSLPYVWLEKRKQKVTILG